MVFGGNSDNVEYRGAVRRARLAVGKCPACPPHGGENYGRKDRRILANGASVPSKPKATK